MCSLYICPPTIDRFVFHWYGNISRILLYEISLSDIIEYMEYKCNARFFKGRDPLKIYTMIGGVNGAGKTSLLGVLRAERTDLGLVADAGELPPLCDASGLEPLAAPQIASALASGVSFTLETTLSGEHPKSLCRKTKAAGYHIRLYYVGLNTPEESIQRIQNRAARGGRSTPKKVVEADFSHRFEDILKVLPYCDEAKFFDNDNGFVLVAVYRNGQILPVGEARPVWLTQLLQAARP